MLKLRLQIYLMRFSKTKWTCHQKIWKKIVSSTHFKEKDAARFICNQDSAVKGLLYQETSKTTLQTQGFHGTKSKQIYLKKREFIKLKNKSLLHKEDRFELTIIKFQKHF